ncbi:MAG: ribosome-associated translation inhibitor RaiA [Chloroflexota bacterium]
MKKAHHTSGGVSVHVKGKNITITPALHDQVIHKMEKLDRYLDRLTSIEVELATEHTKDSNQHNHVEATTHVLGRLIRVKNDDEDMYAAIDGTVDKLYRQLNRQKERLKDHHSGRRDGLLSVTDADAELVADEVTTEENADPQIFVTHLEVKPQFDDEAVAELIASGKVFHVFLNAQNEQVNVVYKRDGGAFGLIEPRVR